MTDSEKYNTIKKIFWDYNIDLLPLKKIAEGSFDTIDKYDFDLIINRMLERLTWFQLIDILGIDMIKKILDEERIKKLRNNELKERYEQIRRLLFNEALPVSG